MNILLLEDYTGLNEAIMTSLLLENHSVESFEDGKEVLKHLDKQYDLYILDIKVPHISGLEVLKVILERFPEAKVIMMSAQTDIESLEQAYEYGCIDYIRKPFHVQELHAKVRRIASDNDSLDTPYLLKSEKSPLTTREKHFLDLICKNPHRVVSYNEISREVYADKVMSMDALRALVRRLRAKLQNDLIENILNEGYKKISHHRRKTDLLGVHPEIKLTNLLKENKNLKRENQELIEAVMIDPLTKLYNRIKIAKCFHFFKKEFLKYQTPFSLLMLDLDHFKKINDTHGHERGDNYLLHIADLLKSTFRENDVIARWGGEEFLILLPHTKIHDAHELTYKVKETIFNTCFEDIGPQSASFGISDFHPHDTIDSMVKRADDALYAVKKSGRNNIKVGEYIY